MESTVLAASTMNWAAAGQPTCEPCGTLLFDDHGFHAHDFDNHKFDNHDFDNSDSPTLVGRNA